MGLFDAQEQNRPARPVENTLQHCQTCNRFLLTSFYILGPVARNWPSDLPKNLHINFKMIQRMPHTTPSVPKAPHRATKGCKKEAKRHQSVQNAAHSFPEAPQRAPKGGQKGAKDGRRHYHIQRKVTLGGLKTHQEHPQVFKMTYECSQRAKHTKTLRFFTLIT